MPSFLIRVGIGVPARWDGLPTSGLNHYVLYFMQMQV